VGQGKLSENPLPLAGEGRRASDGEGGLPQRLYIMIGGGR